MAGAGLNLRLAGRRGASGVSGLRPAPPAAVVTLVSTGAGLRLAVLPSKLLVRLGNTIQCRTNRQEDCGSHFEE